MEVSDDGFVSAARLESHMATNMKTSVGGTHQKLFQNGFKDEFSVVGSVARKICRLCVANADGESVITGLRSLANTLSTFDHLFQDMRQNTIGFVLRDDISLASANDCGTAHVSSLCP